jgi:hypothetical protein
MMRTLPCLVVLVLASGCASLSEDGGFGPVSDAAKQQLNQTVVWARTTAQHDQLAARVAELLREPLTADAAVQVALLNNRALQAAFFELA